MWVVAVVAVVVAAADECNTFFLINYFQQEKQHMAITENIPTPKSIAVTGGKGGTGKTLIAVNLAVQFAREGKKILLIDCDTENPNSNILLGKSLADSDVKSDPVKIFVPTFDDDLCVSRHHEITVFTFDHLNGLTHQHACELIFRNGCRCT